MRLVLLGPPGAGKGTQAAAIRKRLSIPHISTGDMLREAIAAGSPVGRKAKAVVEAGNLVPDDVMAEMVRERLSAPDAHEGFLLDGYPRTVAQAEALDSMLAGLGGRLDAVLYLVLEDAAIVTRLSGRRTCGTCGAPYHVSAAPPARPGVCDACGSALAQRPDDREEAVTRRLSVYRSQTQPLVELYRRRGVLRAVPATGLVEEVGRRVAAALDAAGAPRTAPLGTEGRR